MKTGNILLTGVGVILAGFFWMLLDVRSSSASKIDYTGPMGIALASSKPVLVEFYADWCGACKQAEPAVLDLTREIGTRARVVRLNVDQNAQEARTFEVREIPCFIASKKGKETSRQVGAIPKDAMRSMMGL